MKTMSAMKLAVSAVVAAVYAALTMLLAPISYGEVQLRVSEVLCIMPFFLPCTAPGLFVGCLIANLLSPIGALDIVFGSLATLLAALCTAAIGKSGRGWPQCVLACLQPVLFNAMIVGAVIAFSSISEPFSAAGLAGFGTAALWVGLGELAVMFVIGLPLTRILPRQRFFRIMCDRVNAQDTQNNGR